MFCLAAITFSCKKPDAEKTVVINELMPSNSTIPDPVGEFDDWIELYNTTGSPVDLSGYFLTDNKANLKRWEIPAGTSIPAFGFLIVWADDDALQPGLHASFKLSAAGESAILSAPGPKILDEVSFPAQSQDLSYSRSPDGSGKFVWKNPTPGGPNNTP